MVDPGFPRLGAPTSKVGAKTFLFGQMFPQNCMKMKELESGGGGLASLLTLIVFLKKNGRIV